MGGYAACTRLLIEANADPNWQNTLGDTPTHEAAALGAVDPVQWLVLARGNPQLCNHESRTPVEVAIAFGRRDAAEMLRGHERHPYWCTGQDGIEEEEAQSRRRTELPRGLLRVGHCLDYGD